MGYKAAVQVLKKADPLKAKVSAKHQNLIIDLQAWSDQQQLQTIYHQVLVLDLEYALDKKVEQDLWTLGFKNHISILQEQSRDKKNPKRSESLGLLSWCLEAASGFYLTLLQELCSTYELDLPFRRSGGLFGKLRTCTDSPNSMPQSSSCLYICQYCLVHLGDIARYRNQRQQAESFYKHAILVSPYSGHPYNQLALLEASQGDKLATVFQYVRGIAVKNPFPAAIANLTKTLSATIDKDQKTTQVQTKMRVNEFINLFLKLHALLHTKSDFKEAEICLKSINGTITALIATQSFTCHQLIMITVINMFNLHHIGDGDLTQDEKVASQMSLALLAGSLSAFLLPVYTLKADPTILEYCALPAIRLLLMWIKTKPELLKEDEFSSRLQIWPGYCKLLNIIKEHIDNQYSDEAYTSKPLYFDKELQGFIPLQSAFAKIKFKEAVIQNEAAKHVQALRLIEMGKWLTTYDVNGSKLIINNKEKDVFEPACIQPDPTDKLLEEMKSFNVNEKIEDGKTKERKSGILKPQGSLEKSREERIKLSQDESANASSLKMDNNKLKRVTQNAALQSIYKKLEENKQVTFNTDSNEKKQVTIPKPTLNEPLNQLNQMRTPIVNQNYTGHLSTPEKDYFSYAPPPQIPMPPSTCNNLGSSLNNAHFPNTIDLPPFPFSNSSGNMANNAMFHTQPAQIGSGVAPGKNMYHQRQPAATSGSIFSSQPPALNYNMNLMDHHTSFNGFPFKREERAGNWWPNPPAQPSMPPHLPPPPSMSAQQQTPSFPKSDLYLYNQPNNFPPQVPPPNQQPDMFSPWHNRPNSNPKNQLIPSSSNMPSRPPNMLNDNNQMSMNNSGIGNNLTNNMNSPGYSLFSTNWSPALPQLRNLNTDMRQQSMFTGSMPQSLQQLLEQQNQLQKGDT